MTKNIFINGHFAGFCLWFAIGSFITLIFYQPFEQPIQHDRAYLMYMAQVVARGESLYHATTFGYTPFASIIVGIFMKVGSLFEIDTIQTARIVGMALYAFTCGAMHLLAHSVFNNKRTAIFTNLLFTGIGYLALIAGINGEPKSWVLFFSVLGLFFFQKKNWPLIGLCFSLGAMCWHVSVISLLPCCILLPWGQKNLYKNLCQLSAGVLLGLLPVVVYLALTNGWEDFWTQAIMRKILIEGDSLGESPILWLVNGIYPCFATEALHFVVSALGFGIIIFWIIKSPLSIQQHFSNSSFVRFLVLFSLTWVCFNSFEFQECIDLLPLLPALMLFCGVFYTFFTNWLKSVPLKIITLILFLCYNYGDALLYQIPYTYSEQKKTMENIENQFGKAFVIGFEEFYTVLEKPMPTKFMRFASYEDLLINQVEGTCQNIGEMLLTEKYKQIIEVDRSKRKKSHYTDQLINLFSENKKLPKGSGNCAEKLVQSYTNNIPSDFFKVKLQGIPLGKWFFVEEHYNIYKVKN